MSSITRVNYDPYNGGQINGLPPTKQKTQDEQNQDDEKARKQAEKDLEKSWMDRLQLISVITTFFAANEAQLLSITTPSDGNGTITQQVANAGLSGALVFHSFAAILSFMAAFFLVRYRLQEAKLEKHQNQDPEKQGIMSSNPHVAMQCVGLHSQKPPMHLLGWYHSLCVFMSIIGFILAGVGIMCYVWSMQARSVGIFSSVCVVVCIGSGVAVWLLSARD